MALFPPILLGGPVGWAAPATFTFPQMAGMVEIKNTGAASAWMTLDGSTVPTPGVTQDGQIEVRKGEIITLNGVAVATLIALCATGVTTDLEVAGTPNVQT